MFEKEHNFEELRIRLYNDRIFFPNMTGEQKDDFEGISLEHLDLIHYGKLNKLNLLNNSWKFYCHQNKNI